MIFTIAIPTYNNASTIKATLESCVNQNFDDTFEVLVVINNSTDNTEDILSKYDKKIRIIKNVETVSMYKNHNICLQKAKGDYVVFCHSDDQLLPDALKKYHDILKKRNFPQRYVLWGRSMFRDYFPNWEKGGFHLNEIASGIQALKSFNWGGLTPSGTCYARKPFCEINGFVEANHKLAPSDWVTMWKLTMNYFEFEMADRLFFIRQAASTATGADFNRKNIIDSMADAILSLKDNIHLSKFNSILNYIKKLPDINPRLAIVLIENKLIEKNIIKPKFIKLIIKNPFLIRKKEVRKVLFS